MGLQNIASKLVGAAIQAPRFFGALSIITRKSPKGNSLLETAMKGDLQGVLVDGREVLAGIDDNGDFQFDWIKQTWKPVIIGDLVTRGLQLTRKIISEAL